MAAARWEREQRAEKVAREACSKSMAWDGCNIMGKSVQMAGNGVQDVGKVCKK